MSRVAWADPYLRLATMGRPVFAALARHRQTLQQLPKSDIGTNIVKGWLDAQLSMIRVGLVSLDQVFLPFAQDQQGRTVYERMREQRFSTLALDSANA